MTTTIRKAVFPVAGLGTRFLPATKVLPKEMLPLVDRPLIQNAVEEAKAAGIEEFIFVSSGGKSLMEDHFDRHHQLNKTLQERGKKQALAESEACEIPMGALYVTRQHTALGLGHAVWCARHAVGDEPFAVLLPDDVILAERGCLAQMVDRYNGVGGNLIAVVDVPPDQTDKYGILDVAGDDGKLAGVKGLVEKPDPASAPSTLAIIGRYILQPDIFATLEDQKPGSGNEIQLTDAIAALIGQQSVHGFRFDGTRYDCGNKLGFLEANMAFGLADKEIGPDLRDRLKQLL